MTRHGQPRDGRARPVNAVQTGLPLLVAAVPHMDGDFGDRPRHTGGIPRHVGEHVGPGEGGRRRVDERAVGRERHRPVLPEKRASTIGGIRIAHHLA